MYLYKWLAYTSVKNFTKYIDFSNNILTSFNYKYINDLFTIKYAPGVVPLIMVKLL